jgi:FMN-dependent NADH-azoreductase
VTDVSFIRAEGVAMGDDARNQAIAAAQAEIGKLAEFRKLAA